MSASQGQNAASDYLDCLESPSWRLPSRQNGDATLPKISATFIFAKRLEQPEHIRLNALNNELQQKSPKAWHTLVGPTESFFNDIVRGGLGRVGRPLIFLGEQEGPLDERTVVMHRPDFTDYSAERRDIRLRRSKSKPAEIRWAMRDAFALFQSRHLLYLLSLVSLDEQLDRIDEYALIQMQKLLDPSYEATDLQNKLQFSFDDNIHRSLASLADLPQEPVSLVKTRLRKLAGAVGGGPNGVRDVLKKHVLKKDCELRDFEWADLKSLVFAVEDDQIWKTFATREKQLTSDSRDTKDWQKEELPVSDGWPLHLSPKCPRPQLYALSGFLRGTLDFPLQDTSELEDALEPLCARKDDWAAFFNRQCLIEIGTSEWRSLREARASLGTCPYLALVQCMALYRELLINDLETEIDHLLYRSPQVDDSKEQDIRATAMKDISNTLKRAGESFWPPSSRVVQKNLGQRLSIVRDLLIFRPVNIFSYNMERDLFDALVAYNKIEERTAAIVDLLDRYEGIVEDTHEVLTTAAEQRLSLVLFIIAGLGLLTIYDPVEKLLGQEDHDFLKDLHIDQDRVAIVAVVLAVLAICLLWSRKK